MNLFCFSAPFTALYKRHIAFAFLIEVMSGKEKYVSV